MSEGASAAVKLSSNHTQTTKIRENDDWERKHNAKIETESTKYFKGLVYD